MKKLSISTILAALLIFIFPTEALAAISERCGATGINTAIGCIPALTGNPTDLYAFLLRWAIGVGGGISFLLIVYSGFLILTSQGNPDRLKAGQELLSSAIMGLILLVFSAFVLRVIGVDILAIPGLSQ